MDADQCSNARFAVNLALLESSSFLLASGKTSVLLKSAERVLETSPQMIE